MSRIEPDAVQSKIVVSSVNHFHSSVVDLRPSRTVHSILHHSCRPFFASSSSKAPIDCQAVHFGFCSPVQQLHPKVVPLDSQLPENSRSFNVLKSLSTEIEASDSQFSTPRNSWKEGNLDSIDLLAADVQSNLQALVSSFVARDKINRRATLPDQQTPSPMSPTSSSNIVSNVFSGFASPGTDYNKSRVKKVAAALNKTSTETVSSVKTTGEVETTNLSTSSDDLIACLDQIPQGLSAQNVSSEVPANLDTKQKSDGAKIIRRHKKKTVSTNAQNCRYSSITEQIMRKCEEIAADVEPLSGSLGSEFDKSPKNGGMSAVDYAKSRLQSQKIENYKHQVKGDNGLSSPSGQMVSEAKLRWELSQSKTTHETSLQQQMFNALGLGNGKSRISAASSEKFGIEIQSNPIPHPKLTSMQKQHIRDRSISPTQVDGPGSTPVRPFLTKGSVAERVMLFERAPERSALDKNLANTSASNRIRPATWRTVGTLDYTFKFQSHKEKDKENREPQLHLFPARPSYQTVRRSVKSKSNIPQFYFPKGRPPSSNEVDVKLRKIATEFKDFPNGVKKEDFGEITKACGLSLYWKVPLFLSATEGKSDTLSKETFLNYWKKILSTCNDPASKFVNILSHSKQSYLVADDFIPLVQDIVESHPGLTFLKEATEFHSRYIHTVIARIYYCVNRSWSGKITVPELRKSNFLQILSLLDDEVDINQITEYFSYEHFYVIYCKFWELDKDHDLLIDKNDLSLHNDHAISSRMIERLFSGCVTRGAAKQEGKMSYTEFVWFLISEEDKRHSTSIEYWFRCMDLDGDGILSMYELEYFYEEQLQRMESLGLETLPFQDCLCQMLDIVQPKTKDKITLPDLKRCKMTPVFFDTFFNLEKYLDHEQRDPFASQRDHDCEGIEVSDWERYAAEEYELLVAEEGAGEQQDDMLFDDMEMDDIEDMVGDVESLTLDSINNSSKNGKTFTRSLRPADDDLDYAESDDYS